MEVAPENRCSPYDRDDYPYSPAVEARILKRDGGVIRCRYTGQTFARLKGTDIEHVVAFSEAHDSGLCAAASSRSGARRTRSSFVEPRAGAELDGDVRTTMVGTDYAKGPSTRWASSSSRTCRRFVLPSEIRISAWRRWPIICPAE